MMFSSRLHVLALATLALSQTTVSAANCDCWKNKEDGLLFTNYKSLDFSALCKYAVPAPGLITDAKTNQKAGVTSSYFNSAPWTNFFSLQTWNQAPSPPDSTINRINSQSNAYIQNNTDGTTFLTLRTYRTRKFQSTVEAQSPLDQYASASIRYRARIHGDKGACAGAFTYKADDSGAEHESDLEILTSDPTNVVHYTTHPEEEDHDFDGTGTIAAPDSARWTNWQDHRLDWTQPKTTWYLNGKKNGQLTHEYPQLPSYLIFNMWSEGNPGWEGTMPVGGSAYFDIQSIQVAYNTSTPSTRACKNTCTLA